MKNKRKKSHQSKNDSEIWDFCMCVNNGETPVIDFLFFFSSIFCVGFTMHIQRDQIVVLNLTSWNVHHVISSLFRSIVVVYFCACRKPTVRNRNVAIFDIRCRITFHSNCAIRRLYSIRFSACNSCLVRCTLDSWVPMNCSYFFFVFPFSFIRSRSIELRSKKGKRKRKKQRLNRFQIYFRIFSSASSLRDCI